MTKRNKIEQHDNRKIKATRATFDSRKQIGKGKVDRFAATNVL